MRRTQELEPNGAGRLVRALPALYNSNMPKKRLALRR